MIDLNKQLIRIILVAAAALPWGAAPAVENFEKAGPITSIGIDRFTVAGKAYRIAPAAKLRSGDPARRSFRDFKTGDRIWFKGTTLDGVHFVDMIVYETPDEN